MYVPSFFDTGTKVIFQGKPYQRVGAFNAADLVNITLDHHPEAPRHLARALYKFFVKVEPTEPIVAELAALLKSSNYEVAPAVRRILSSRAFFSTEARRAGVKTPLEFTIGLLHATGLEFRINHLQWKLEDMGFMLYAPPSVKGWDDDGYWLNDQWTISRVGFIHDVLNDNSYRNDNFSLAYLLPSATADANAFLLAVSSRLSVDLSAQEKTHVLGYLNWIKNWDDTTEPWLFDPRHSDNFETKARGLLFILAQHDSYQMD